MRFHVTCECGTLLGVPNDGKRHICPGCLKFIRCFTGQRSIGEVTSLGKGGPEILKIHGMMKRIEPMEAARPRRIVRWEDDSEELDEEECYSEDVEGEVLGPFIRIAVAALLILALAGALLYGVGL